MKKFTCINDKETKVDGAIEGTKAQVLAWMKKKFPEIRERVHDEMMTALEFFYERGEIKAYETADGEYIYLAEIAGKEPSDIEGVDKS